MSVSALSKNDQDVVFQMYSEGESKAAIARNFEVSPRTIGRIISKYELSNGDDESKKIDPYHYEYIITGQLIVLTRSTNQQSEVVTITKDDERYETMKAIVERSIAESDNSIVGEAFLESSVSAKIESQSFGNVRVNIEDMTIEYVYSGSGEVLTIPEKLTKRVIAVLEGGAEGNPEFEGLIKFIEKLAFNPDPEVIDRLYDFIAPNNIDITPEGNVRCFKKVRGDFLDIYTGKIDNSPGKTVRVKREYVVKDQNITCTQGLHVCSFNYLPSYGNESSNVVVEVDVDPADFVSIPTDYHDAKARVCGYKVIRQLETDDPWNQDYNDRFNPDNYSFDSDDDGY